jgi:hypothetical protein
MSQNADDRVTVYLAVESLELTPSMLTDRLAVRPDREWIKGDRRGRTGKCWERHGWIIESTVRSIDHGGRPASALLPLALAEFETRAGPLVEVIAQLGPSVQIYVVLGIVAEEAPGIELSHEFLKLTTFLGGTLQIDLAV